MTTEYLFYHSQKRPLQSVLPQLLEKTRQRGWRALVRFSSPELMDAIDSALWTYREDSFLAHATPRDGFTERQPILLTLDINNPNKADVLFVLETASSDDSDGYVRVVRLFDDVDEAAKAFARSQWKTLKERGLTGSYWKQDEAGRWVKAG